MSNIKPFTGQMLYQIKYIYNYEDAFVIFSCTNREKALVVRDVLKKIYGTKIELHQFILSDLDAVFSIDFAIEDSLYEIERITRLLP